MPKPKVIQLPSANPSGQDKAWKDYLRKMYRTKRARVVQPA